MVGCFLAPLLRLRRLSTTKSMMKAYTKRGPCTRSRNLITSVEAYDFITISKLEPKNMH